MFQTTNQYFSYISISIQGPAKQFETHPCWDGCVKKLTHKSNGLSTITLLKSPFWGPHSQAYLNNLQDQILGSYFPLYVHDGPI